MKNRFCESSCFARVAVMPAVMAMIMNTSVVFAEDVNSPDFSSRCTPMNPEAMATQECANYQMSMFYFTMSSLMVNMSESESAQKWYETPDGNKIVKARESEIAVGMNQKAMWERCQESNESACAPLRAKVEGAARQMAFGSLVAETIVNAGILVNRLKEDSDNLRKAYPAGATQAIAAGLYNLGLEINRINYSMSVMTNTMGKMGSFIP